MTAQIVALAVCVCVSIANAEVIETDVCVFGGTSAGIIAGIQAWRGWEQWICHMAERNLTIGYWTSALTVTPCG
jgi:hypothetical protein